MLNTGKILLLLFLLNYLYCAPDRYIRENKGKINKCDHSERDENYAWSDADENTGYDAPPERNSPYPHSKENTPEKKCYQEIPPVENKYTPARRQKPSYIIFNSPDRPENRKNPVVKNKNNNPPGNDIIKRRWKYRSYRVRTGDNLTGIAKSFNMEVDYICKMNRIKNPNDIYAGMILKLAPKNNTIEKIKTSNDKIDIKPSFEWPLKDVINVKRDGDDGVRSIGIIITGKKGSKILSSAAGTVKKIGQMRGFGNFIILKHPERYFTIYSNLNNISVSEGEKVGTGKMIGRLDGNKLHFQIDNSGKPEDPLKYLSRKR